MKDENTPGSKTGLTGARFLADAANRKKKKRALRILKDSIRLAILKLALSFPFSLDERRQSADLEKTFIGQGAREKRVKGQTQNPQGLS